MKTSWLIIPLYAFLALYPRLHGADAPASLRETVLAKEAPYEGFTTPDNALVQIEERTGCELIMEPQLRDFLHTNYVGMSIGKKSDTKSDTISNRRFLDYVVCGALGLQWSMDEKASAITLKIAWRVPTQQSPKELLAHLMQVREAVEEAAKKQSREERLKDRYSYKVTEDGAALDVLLSHPKNFERAWRCRQYSTGLDTLRMDYLLSITMEPNFPLPPPAAPPHCKILKVLTSSLETRILVWTGYCSYTIPGRSAISYYSFKEDGTLVVADSFGSGDGNVQLGGVSILPEAETAKIAKPAVLKISYGRWGGSLDKYFLLTDEGLQRIKDNNLNAQPLQLEKMESLIPKD